jgi:predicted nucleotidyltransferase
LLRIDLAADIMNPPMHDRDGQLPDPIAAHAAEIRTACARHSVSSLALVGSAARADFDPSRSDIDVLVDFVDGDINYFRAFMGLREELAAILGRRVDVITRRGVRNPLLLRSLERDAIPVYPANAA